MLQTIFWCALLLTVYVYAGYPLLLMFWSRLAPRRIHRQNIEPTVSIVISMHNEQANVTQRMRNLMELDYPADKLEVVLSLDACSDGTVELLAPWESSRVRIIQNPLRGGKAVALNRGVAAATGEIVLFADARQKFAPDAVRKLVADFADESVGAVSGELILLDHDGHETADSVSAYWRYEKALRCMESTIHSVPGGTGSILAVRRDLFTPLPAKTILDDVMTPMRIVLRGKRAIFEPAARAYDSANLDLALEYARKRRTLMGNYEIFAAMPEVFLPWRNPIVWQIASHKAGRLLVPWCLTALFVSSLLLRHGIFAAALAVQIAFYALALMGSRFSGNKLAGPAYTFVLMNWAAVAGLVYFLRGHDGFWDVSRFKSNAAERVKCKA